MSFLEELKRRNVFRVAVAYVVTAWLLIEISATLEQTLRLPDWADTLMAFFLILGFPLALFFSWAFEITPEGVKREKDLAPDHEQASRSIAARKLNRIIVVMMALALVYFAVDKFVMHDEPTAADVATKVDGAEGPQVAQSVPDLSIAVLPFVNMSSDAEQEYFSDGLTEELLNLLAGIGELKVAARTSSFFYKDKLNSIPLTEIAGQLAVAHILEGSVRKNGNEIRITAQLIKAEGGFHLWSRTWDRRLDDIFAVQDEIAAAVADELKVTLMGESGKSKIIDTESFEQALQGRYYYNRRNDGDLQRAFDRFTRAVEIDPENAVAWIGLVPLHLYLNNPPDIDNAMTAVTKALALEPDNPEALIRHSQLLYRFDRADEGDAEWARALELGQDNALVLSMLAGVFCEQGDLDECIRYQKRAVDLDPLHPVNLSNLSGYYTLARDYEKAEPPLRKLLEFLPGKSGAILDLAHIRLLQEDPGEAMVLLGQVELAASELGNDAAQKAQLIAIVEFSLGNRAAADKALQNFIDTFGDQYLLRLAEIYAWRGENEKAIAILEGLTKDQNVSATDLRQPLLSGLEYDPRWQQLQEH